MPSRYNEGDYPYAYQGQEKDTETGMEAFELRLWDARLGRWLTTNPYGQFHSPYLGMGNNPVSRVDPDGGFSPPNEYLQNSEGGFDQISNLGGEETNFYHYTIGTNAGKTQITNGLSSTWMSSSNFLLGYMIRDFNTDWSHITNEFIEGNGPANSVFYGSDHPTNQELNLSFAAFKARDKFLNSGGGKVRGSANFGLAGLLRSNVNLTEQMVGSASFSVYPLGDDRVVMMLFDSKSRTSLYYHLPVDNHERGQFRYINHGLGVYEYGMDNREATTRQTYIWIESIKTLKQNHYIYDTRYDSDY